MVTYLAFSQKFKRTQNCFWKCFLFSLQFYCIKNLLGTLGLELRARAGFGLCGLKKFRLGYLWACQKCLGRVGLSGSGYPNPALIKITLCLWILSGTFICKYFLGYFYTRWTGNYSWSCRWFYTNRIQLQRQENIFWKHDLGRSKWLAIETKLTSYLSFYPN